MVAKLFWCNITEANNTSKSVDDGDIKDKQKLTFNTDKIKYACSKGHVIIV